MLNNQLLHIKRGTYLIIRTDGREERVEKPPTLATIANEIGADTLDFVSVGRAARNDIIMAVDDFGWETEAVDHGGGRVELRPTKARKPVNEKATILYHAVCVSGTTHQIVGDVALWHDGDSR